MRILAGLIIGLIIGGGITFFIFGENFNFLKNNKSYTVQSAELPKPPPVSKEGIHQLFNIDTTIVTKKFLYKNIRAYGTLEHPENDLKDITFKISGYVEKLYADFTGKYIKKGEPLLSVYSPQLVSAQEEFLRAYRYYESMKNSPDLVLRKSAEDLYSAAYKRLKYWDITDQQIENLKKTGKVQKTMTLYSPYDGWVMEKFVYLGSEVKEGKPVMRIAKHKNLWLIANLYEEDIRFVKDGQEVEFYFVSYPERTIRGKIDYIYPMMDKKKRTLKVRVVVDNSEKMFFPGMYGEVVLKVPLGESMVLPETAVLNTGKKKVVFVQVEKGVFEPVFVKLGVYTDGYYQILEGVHPGMVVANSALFLLDADAQLKGKYSKDKKPMKMMHHH
ncbi:membrane fusion protein, Cu(I)/Ag(I) efflux system [Persephonella hydrogeniphila]|uniref:Membrane fusion protein, Cu(I)/Ag(I) efflux system n=1 Tax=Persephonella hydrogeniphila TaxID=198703 RepID=A0A285NEW2_9AQUI|nr:efflux RND transporter periplasmic adaptor subunit [Persephonella hydrogeniphila]SNZ08042.1 membrane fusion protein, Cu(I)/Ag(I) efflux system [Persephonella hydrogeniphila]